MANKPNTTPTQEVLFTTLLMMHTALRDSQPRTPLQTCTTNKAAAMEQGNNCTYNYPQDPNPAPRCMWDWIHTWQEQEQDIHWPFLFPSGSDPIDDAIFIACSTKPPLASPKPYRATLAHSGVMQWLCSCTIDLITKHSSQQTGPEQWYSPLENTITVSGQCATPTPMEWMKQHHRHSSDKHFRRRSQRSITTDHPSQAMNNHSPLTHH